MVGESSSSCAVAHPLQWIRALKGWRVSGNYVEAAKKLTKVSATAAVVP